MIPITSPMPAVKSSRSLNESKGVEENQGQLPQPVTIDALSDNVLLEIFNVYLDEYQFCSIGNTSGQHFHDGWHTLVHVCDRWRCVVFASPRRLGVQVLYTIGRSVEKMLDFWPALPIAIEVSGILSPWQGTDNIISLLEHHDRVSDINLEDVPNVQLEAITAATKKPFPALTHLCLSSYDLPAPILPDSFLGGSAPCLQVLVLEGISFPGLGKLLPSTTGLVELHLSDIPDSGYISPEAMVTSLSALTNLKGFALEFRYPRSQTDRASRHPPSLTPVALPALTHLSFQGDSDYLEAIVSRIDAPLLDRAYLAFFEQSISDTPQLRRFISHIMTFKPPRQADVLLYQYVSVKLFRQDGTDYHRSLELTVSYHPQESQFSPPLRLCRSILPPLSTLERLKIDDSSGGRLNIGENLL